MPEAFSWAIVIAPLIGQLLLCRFLYLVLYRKILAHQLKALGACLLFCLAMAIVPWLVAGITGGLGVYLFTYHPLLRPASWDVALAMTLFMLLWFSYFVSVICALFVCASLLRAAQADKAASAS